MWSSIILQINELRLKQIDNNNKISVHRIQMVNDGDEGGQKKKNQSNKQNTKKHNLKTKLVSFWISKPEVWFCFIFSFIFL